MSVARTAWQRWKRFARRATEIQSNVVLLILYFVFFVPVALFRRWFITRPADRPAPAWHARESADHSLEAARRQF